MESEDELIKGKCGVNCTWEYDEINGKLILKGNGEIDNYSDENEIPWKEKDLQYERTQINSLRVMVVLGQFLVETEQEQCAVFQLVPLA